MSAAGAYRHFYDRDKIYFFVRNSVWHRHILRFHSEKAGNESAIRQALAWPEQITRNVKKGHRIIFYRRGVLKGMELELYLKVVVEYSENEWGERAGEIVTAYSVNEIPDWEERIWPDDPSAPM